MDSFATPKEMEDRSGGQIPADTPFLQMALDAASQKIRNYCGWHIAPTASTVWRQRPFRQFRTDIFLPSLQIVSVDVVEDHTGEFDVDVDFDPDTGATDLCGAGLKITFTHGFEEPPADLVDMTLMMASRALGSPLGYTREQSGQRSVSASLTAAGVAGGTVLMAHERDELTAYKIGALP